MQNDITPFRLVFIVEPAGPGPEFGGRQLGALINYELCYFTPGWNVKGGSPEGTHDLPKGCSEAVS